MDSERKFYLAKSFNPRIALRKEKGIRTMAEQKIIGQLARIRGKSAGDKIDMEKVTNKKVMGILSISGSNHFTEEEEEEEVGEIDSLLASAFNSERNKEWDQYKMSIEQPPVSEASHERFFIHGDDSNYLVPDDRENPNNSDVLSEGSSLSSNYSYIENFQENRDEGNVTLQKMKEISLQKIGSVLANQTGIILNKIYEERNQQTIDNNQNQWRFNSIKGIWLPQLFKPSIRQKIIEQDKEPFKPRKVKKQTKKEIYKSCERNKFYHPNPIKINKETNEFYAYTQPETLIELLDSFQRQIYYYKLTKKKKLSSNLLMEIYNYWSKQLSAMPFDITKHLQINGHLLFNNYWLSETQQQNIALFIPCIFNLRCIELTDCSISDASSQLIIKAISQLTKIQKLAIGGKSNILGVYFVRSLNNQRLQSKLIEIDLHQLHSSSLPYFSKILKNLSQFKHLQNLNLSQNILSCDSIDQLCLILCNHSLKILNLSGSISPTGTNQKLGIKKLFTGLLKNQTLEYLDLSANNLANNPEFTILLSKLIQNSKTLKHLNLQQCDLKSEQILYVVHCLKMAQIELQETVQDRLDQEGQIGFFSIHLGRNIGYTGLVHLLVKKILKASANCEFDCSVQVFKQMDQQRVLSINMFQIYDLLFNFENDELRENLPVCDIDELVERLKKSFQSVQDIGIDLVLDKKDLVIDSLDQSVQIEQLKAILNGINQEQNQKKGIKKMSQSADKVQQYFDTKQRQYDLFQFIDFYGKKYELYYLDALKQSSIARNYSQKLLGNEQDTDKNEFEEFKKTMAQMFNNDVEDSDSKFLQSPKFKTLRELERSFSLKEQSNRVTIKDKSVRSSQNPTKQTVETLGDIQSQTKSDQNVAEEIGKIIKNGYMMMGKKDDQIIDTFKVDGFWGTGSIGQEITKQNRLGTGISQQFLDYIKAVNNIRDKHLISDIIRLVKPNSQEIPFLQNFIQLSIFLNDLKAVQIEQLQINNSQLEKPIFQDIIFTRKINQKDDKFDIEWEYSNNCFICEKHEMVSFKIDSINDLEIGNEIIHVSSIFNQNLQQQKFQTFIDQIDQNQLQLQLQQQQQVNKPQVQQKVNKKYPTQIIRRKNEYNSNKRNIVQILSEKPQDKNIHVKNLNRTVQKLFVANQFFRDELVDNKFPQVFEKLYFEEEENIRVNIQKQLSESDELVSRHSSEKSQNLIQLSHSEITTPISFNFYREHQFQSQIPITYDLNKLENSLSFNTTLYHSSIQPKPINSQSIVNMVVASKEIVPIKVCLGNGFLTSSDESEDSEIDEAKLSPTSQKLYQRFNKYKLNNSQQNVESSDVWSPTESMQNIQPGFKTLTCPKSQPNIRNNRIVSETQILGCNQSQNLQFAKMIHSSNDFSQNSSQNLFCMTNIQEYQNGKIAEKPFETRNHELLNLAQSHDLKGSSNISTKVGGSTHLASAVQKRVRNVAKSVNITQFLKKVQETDTDMKSDAQDNHSLQFFDKQSLVQQDYDSDEKKNILQEQNQLYGNSQDNLFEQGWFRLAQFKNLVVDQASYYLVASFNNWFPILLDQKCSASYFLETNMQKHKQRNYEDTLKDSLSSTISSDHAMFDQVIKQVIKSFTEKQTFEHFAPSSKQEGVMRQLVDYLVESIKKQVKTKKTSLNFQEYSKPSKSGYQSCQLSYERYLNQGQHYFYFVKVQKIKQEKIKVDQTRDWKEILKQTQNKLNIEPQLEYRICLSNKYQKTLLPGTQVNVNTFYIKPRTTQYI